MHGVSASAGASSVLSMFGAGAPGSAMSAKKKSHVYMSKPDVIGMEGEDHGVQGLSQMINRSVKCSV